MAATIVIVEHAMQEHLGVPYMAHAIADRWEAQGHRVILHRGLDPPAGDIALLHVDLTVIPEAYRAAASRCARVINAGSWDISKRHVSSSLVARGDPWTGPVIVKTDANMSGWAEARLARAQRESGIEQDVRVDPTLENYALFRTLADVPPEAWDTPSLVVEKFLPEVDARGYHLRVWTFFGDRERSSLCTSASRIIKAANVTAREEVEVPEAMRAERRRLGFDYGKFDYVRHGDRYYLLDANRTPSAPAGPSGSGLERAIDELALGIDSFL